MGIADWVWLLQKIISRTIFVIPISQDPADSGTIFLPRLSRVQYCLTLKGNYLHFIT